MPTVAFRFVHPSSGKTTGYVGIASARTKYDLFWLINEFDDATACEVAQVTDMGICVHPGTKRVLTSDSLHPEILKDLKWEKPKWPEDVKKIRFK